MRASWLAAAGFLFIVTAGLRAESPVEGAWVLSEKWAGFMGIALVVKGEAYQYWFYSDVRRPEELRYPLRGKASFADGVLTLTEKPGAELYDTRWHVVRWKRQRCLLAEEDHQDYVKTGKMPADRLLFRLENFDAGKPQLNMPGKGER